MEQTCLCKAVETFAFRGNVTECIPYGNGHINETYRITTDAGERYILQRLNAYIYKKPLDLIENVVSVTHYLAKSSIEPRDYMHFVPTTDGKAYFYKDAEERYWRASEFVKDSVCFEQATPEIFRASGIAFGTFQRRMTGFDTGNMHELLPDFHNTVNRYRLFKDAVVRDVANRSQTCLEEIRFILEREQDAHSIVEPLFSGDIPWRVTHNDTKLDNVLFDANTNAPLCVIDLDSVMPGSLLYDFGDSIRFGASSATEDEQDLGKVNFVPELFREYVEGFLEGVGDAITEKEIALMSISARVITLEQALRFLADYLDGDVYYHTSRPNQNLDRARTQIKLVSDMEKCFDQMCDIVDAARKKSYS